MKIYTNQINRFYCENIANSRKKYAIDGVCKDLSSYAYEHVKYNCFYVPAEIVENACKNNGITVKTFLKYVPHSVCYYYDTEEAFYVPYDEIYGENFTDFSEDLHYTGVHGIYSKLGYEIVNVKKEYLLHIEGLAFKYSNGKQYRDFLVMWSEFDHKFSEDPTVLFSDIIADNMEDNWYNNFQSVARSNIFDYYLDNNDHSYTSSVFYDEVETETERLISTAIDEIEVFFTFYYILELEHEFCEDEYDLESFIIDLLK